ncbi:SHOCT domain-containing protein [Rhodovibrionaceae bacterium A322]
MVNGKSKWILALPLVALLSACGGGGADSNADVKIKTTTTGQELQDLKKAYDAGALTESEYNKQRKAILDKANKS